MNKLVSQNKKARHEYFIEDTFESGIVLTGSEVKSVRENGMIIESAFVANIKGSLMLIGSFIPKYSKTSIDGHEESRYRKLLLHKSETRRILGKVKKPGYTMVALKTYFNSRNILKLELAIAKGKAAPDKRQVQKEKDWNREQSRLLKRR
jgi:SsrA-binding protein